MLPKAQTGSRVSSANGNERNPPRGLPETDGAMNAKEKEQLWREFDAAWERGIKTRCKYSFIKTYKPVIDAVPFRAWKSTADYRRWCDENVPSWLGYGNH